MSDNVSLSRSNAHNAARQDAPRNVFSDGLLGLTFRTWGKHHVARKGNTRPKYDAWRLRWWYHSAIVMNHRKTIGGQCHKAFVHPRYGLLPLAVAKRWTHRRGPFLDLLVFEDEERQS